jgi:hypothetical protein
VQLTARSVGTLPHRADHVITIVALALCLADHLKVCEPRRFASLMHENTSTRLAAGQGSAP